VKWIQIMLDIWYLRQLLKLKMVGWISDIFFNPSLREHLVVFRKLIWTCENDSSDTDSYKFFSAYYNKFLGVTGQIYDKISHVMRWLNRCVVKMFIRIHPYYVPAYYHYNSLHIQVMMAKCLCCIINSCRLRFF